MSKLKTKHFLIFFGVVILILFLFRFLSPEDSWVCQNGEWIKHGSPTVEQPTTKCETK